VINVADIDYSDEPILAHLTSNLDPSRSSPRWRRRLGGPASHAASVDARSSQASTVRYPSARPSSTHSLEMPVSPGGALGLAARYDQARRIHHPLEKALIENERVCWHLSSDGARWRFHVERM